MEYTEQAVVFNCDESRLVGIVTLPETPAETGVVIVVGGPQYRAGSHRQFTLLARHLAKQGIASMRFDYRGMGDSEGEMRNFELIDDDIRAAIDTLLRHIPEVHRVVLWGLCDAASASLFYAYTDTRVGGLVLLNPWVHTETGASRARIKHYYLSRLLQRSFWMKLISGGVKLGSSIGDLAKSAQNVVSGADKTAGISANAMHGSSGYIRKMLEGMEHFKGEVMIILSGNDLVAQEFEYLVSHESQWKKTFNSSSVIKNKLIGASHTFSSQVWRRQVEQWTIELIHKLQKDSPGG